MSDFFDDRDIESEEEISEIEDEEEFSANPNRKRRRGMEESDDDSLVDAADVVVRPVELQHMTVPGTPLLDQHAETLVSHASSEPLPEITLYEMGNELGRKWLKFLHENDNRLQCAYALYDLRADEHHDMEILEKKLRKFRSRVLSLYWRYAFEKIVQHDEYNEISEISRRFTRIVHIMKYCHDAIRSDQLTRNFSDLNIDFAVSQNMSFYEFKLNTDGSDETPYQELLRHLLSEAYQRGYRKKDDTLYKQIVLGGQLRTHAWEVAMTLKEFTYNATKKEVDPVQWKNVTKSRGNVSAACEYLEHSQDYEIPRLVSDRYLFSFKNAMYNAMNNELHRYGPSSNIPSTAVSSNYIKQVVPRSIEQLLEMRSFGIWRYIDTPHTDLVLKSQHLHQQIRAKKGKYSGDFVNARVGEEWYWGHVQRIEDGDPQHGGVSTNATFDIAMVLNLGNHFHVMVDGDDIDALTVEIVKVHQTSRVFEVNILDDKNDEDKDDEDDEDDERMDERDDERMDERLNEWLSQFRAKNRLGDPSVGQKVVAEIKPGKHFVFGHVTAVSDEGMTVKVSELLLDEKDEDGEDGGDGEDNEHEGCYEFIVSDVYSPEMCFTVQDWWSVVDDPPTCVLREFFRSERGAVQMVLDTQKQARHTAYQVPFECVRGTPLDWTYAFVGRMLYELNVFDQWSVIPFLKGKAGTGKSTLAKLVSWFYASHNVGILSNNSEAKFGLSAIYQSLVWLCMEVKSDMQLSQAEFQSMVSGENMNIPIKNQTAKSNVMWSSPGMLCGNESAPWCDAAGSIERRVLWILFDYSIPSDKSDMNLDKKLKGELGSLIVKANCVYREFAALFGNKSVWGAVPKWFTENSRKLRTETQPVAAFIEDNETLRVNTTYYMPLNEFRDQFLTYTQSVGLRKVRWNADLYGKTFENEGLKIEKQTMKAWPPGDDILVSKTWLLGIGPMDHANDFEVGGQ
tara:strand:- start:211 stop:3093 length:2883 start_codon:yes stop_codon:yes gene_type:complete